MADQVSYRSCSERRLRELFGDRALEVNGNNDEDAPEPCARPLHICGRLPQEPSMENLFLLARSQTLRHPSFRETLTVLLYSIISPTAVKTRYELDMERCFCAEFPYARDRRLILLLVLEAVNGSQTTDLQISQQAWEAFIHSVVVNPPKVSRTTNSLDKIQPILASLEIRPDKASLLRRSLDNLLSLNFVHTMGSQRGRRAGLSWNDRCS